MKALYSKIVEVINAAKSKFVERELPAPETIELYQGQPEKTGLFTFNTPAVFIDYQIDWEEGRGQRKSGVITASIHVLVDSPTFSLKKRMDTLKKLEYYELLISILEGITSEETGGLTLIIEETVKTDLCVYPIFHFIAHTNRSFQTPLTKMEALPDITMNQ